MNDHEKNMKEITKENWRNYCIYSGGTTLQDLVFVDDVGVVRSQCFRKTLPEYRTENPNAELWLYEDAFKEIEKAQEREYKHPPVEITEERFSEMLNVLPPDDWARGGTTESFKMCEKMMGVYTSIFCRIGDRYFEMMDDYKTRHDVIRDMCRETIQKGQVTA